MKALLIANTVITNKEQARNFMKKLNSFFLEEKTFEMASVIDEYAERLVSAGFLTWEETESF